MPNDDSYTAIEPCAGETYLWDGTTYAVYRYEPYEEWSVNAGQTKRLFLDSSEDLAKLKRDYPAAEVTEVGGYVPQEIPHTPPAWFNPANAGETWSELDL